MIHESPPSARPEADTTDKRGQNGTETTHRSLWLLPRTYGDDEKDGGASEPRIDRLGACCNILRDRRRHAQLLGQSVIDHQYGTRTGHRRPPEIGAPTHVQDRHCVSL